MADKARKAAALRIRTLTVPLKVRASDVLVLFLIGLLLRCGDIEQNPGPGEKGPSQTSSTSQRTTEGVGLKEELLTGMQEMMQKMFELQKVSFEQSIQELKEQISGALDSLVADVDDLKERTKAIEEATVNMTMKNDEHRAAIDALENRMEEMTQRLDDKIDKLESFSKRDNLKFFNVAESTEPENYDSCAKKILDLLQNCVPDRVWQLSDIVRAHRLGTDKNRNDSGSNNSGNDRRPRPIIVKFAHWGAKMHVLTKGRDGLKRQGVAVAGGLTTRQQSIIKQYRNDGIRAYYKGNQLVVGGRLQPRPQNGRNNNAGRGGCGSHRSRSPPSPGYSDVAQRSSVGGNSADVTSTSASGKSNTTSSGMNSVPGVLTRNRAQSQSQATRDADTMLNS